MTSTTEALLVAAEVLTERRWGYDRETILSNIDLNDRALFDCAYSLMELNREAAQGSEIDEAVSVGLRHLEALIAGTSEEELSTRTPDELRKIEKILWREYERSVRSQRLLAKSH